jgi:uncharacterized protein YecT (DUF1311 family)
MFCLFKVVAAALAASSLLVLAPKPQAAESEADPVESTSQDPCASGSAIGSIRCMSASWERAETELNAEYQLALRRLKVTASASIQQKFLESQRQWVRYRDAHCTFEADAEVEGNAWNSFHRANCKAERATARAQYLRKVWAD